MKRAIIRAQFLELRSPDAHQSGEGTGSSGKVAINRAMNNLLAKVKGKRYGSFQATIFISEAASAEGAVQ
jgi:hypothetical protein